MTLHGLLQNRHGYVRKVKYFLCRCYTSSRPRPLKLDGVPLTFSRSLARSINSEERPSSMNSLAVCPPLSRTWNGSGEERPTWRMLRSKFGVLHLGASTDESKSWPLLSSSFGSGRVEWKVPQIFWRNDGQWLYLSHGRYGAGSETATNLTFALPKKTAWYLQFFVLYEHRRA